ncbi:MAG: hypothetical protein U0Q16_07420 [Bryobacteraceae bacterium]
MNGSGFPPGAQDAAHLDKVAKTIGMDPQRDLRQVIVAPAGQSDSKALVLVSANYDEATRLVERGSNHTQSPLTDAPTTSGAGRVLRRRAQCSADGA